MHDPDYRYPGDDLGEIWTPEYTSFKLWAPSAEGVTLLLFEDPRAETSKPVPMRPDPDGIWHVRVDGNLDGKYYLYEIIHPASGERPRKVIRVQDPYATGSSANSGRSLVYDPRGTDPEGWDRDRFVPLANQVDAVLYELHLRDFTISRTSGVPDAIRGRYLGLTAAGTRSPSGEKTGLEHLSELGITHVHLLPVFDYAFGDETEETNRYTWYNWGYDPVLFNTPEGSYASSADGSARQREFKLLVQALHARGIGVVLDTVYNHTAQTGDGEYSVFDKVVPGYYYRRNPDGSYANASGCGNEFASERPMARKFIVDSIRYWMREYHIDGFRFDLLGLIDRETMQEIRREAKKINRSAILYGEGWNMEKVLPEALMMTQEHVAGTGIAAFNDGIRDNLKGDAFRVSAKGFIQGGKPAYGGMERLMRNIRAVSTGREKHDIPIETPGECVNYLSCHDNHCLWDRLAASAEAASIEERAAMARLGIGIVLLSQGIPFLHAGDEFLRSKCGVENSFNNNHPGVNPVDWTRKEEYRPVFDFVCGLIALRKAHPAFRMTDAGMVEHHLAFIHGLPEVILAFRLHGHANGDPWKQILAAANSGAEPFELPAKGEWEIVCDGIRSGTEPLRKAKDIIAVPPRSLVVAREV